MPSRFSFHSMTSDPGVRARGGARGQNLVHFQNEVFNPYLDNHLSESIQTGTRGTILGKLSFHDI